VIWNTILIYDTPLSPVWRNVKGFWKGELGPYDEKGSKELNYGSICD
jgi:hypothetical protein